jgi:WD40 repeat protein
VRVWDAARGQELLTLTGHTSIVTSVCFSPDGTRLASGSGGGDQQKQQFSGEVKVWDVGTGKEVLTLKGHTEWFCGLAWSPDGSRLASASYDQTVKVWDVERGQELLTLKGHTAPVWIVCFSPDGTRLASASHDCTVKVWDAKSGQEVFTLRGHTGGVTSVCFSPDGKRLVSTSVDNTVKVRDLAEEERLRAAGDQR